MRRAGPFDVAAALAAVFGAFLAVDAWQAGSLWRYQLAGAVAGGWLALPLLSVIVFGDRARRTWRLVAFALVPLAALLVVAEVAVRLVAPPRLLPARLIPDPYLGHLVAPGTAGTDAHGFRNEATPERADVLWVGDSQTWGFDVAIEQTFASIHAARANVRGYQMANGSYGPVQYRELVRRGLALHPRLVVVVCYLGNDLVDAVDYAGLEGAADLRSPGREYRVRDNVELSRVTAPNVTMAIVDAVFASSRVLDFFGDRVKRLLRGGVLDHQPGAVPFVHDRVPTILLPDYRAPLVDDRESKVREGLAVSGRCLGSIAALCADAGARCLVVLLPTKEACYARFAAESRLQIPSLDALREAGARARHELTTHARAAGLDVIDLEDDLVAALHAGTPVWPPTGDGHLNAAGHVLLAEAVLRHQR
jgi:hypothetical protein